MTEFPSIPDLDPMALFEGIDTEYPVMLAVSGGSDSLALLFLAHAWAQRSGAQLQAVTIDHGLRPEAAAEAAFVAGVCAGLDIDHVTLAWEGIKPSFGIQESARQSRYSLLENFAHEIGADFILTGHTADDQAETVLMRALRQGGEGDGRGLAGMARKTFLYGGKQIIRPLLACSREQLRQYLISMTQSWVEDPSNHDISFERVRVRRSMAGDGDNIRRVMRLAELSSRMRSLASRSVADLLERRCRMLPGPVLEFRLEQDGAGGNSLLAQCLQVMIALAGGQLHMVSRKRLQPVLDLVSGDYSNSAKSSRTTLGGAVIERRGRELLFYRESRNLTPLLLDPGEAAIWDGRLHVHNGTHMQIFIEPAGRQQIREFEQFRGQAYEVKRRAALWSTPVVHVQTDESETTPLLPLVENVPVPPGLELRQACPAIEHFCPQWDEPLRDWVRSFDRHTAARIQP